MQGDLCYTEDKVHLVDMLLFVMDMIITITSILIGVGVALLMDISR
ncbi:hypothetical protein SDC9_175072 [bioreactor metagenome]|uniref:Uncharacterized protein n=1 Tax=bioreactor metagenome TaxID=1076179 RepID=A0A645GL37_9ZZZZ